MSPLKEREDQLSLRDEYISQLKQEMSPLREREDQLSSRDEYIYQLKQEMATLVKIKQELATENDQLRSQLLSVPIKKEGTNHLHGNWIIELCCSRHNKHIVPRRFDPWIFFSLTN